ncbi:phosphoribosylglycinamide formyltransferase [Cytophaga hutchinsonii]|jgi:phosphoribosylglycinamide formyltransferase-1|uniref:Phosphoribosylglycinamide formyltransferase n=1 Tax=Cytophaga hutchinsonii (strain ATCC 33406 / DSM 1761 / CIP 103989 / NBRC 15051 / NCIMB 9469 / D465) TaxID=269798 RepID=A0A6N4SVI7_CYTH3|nr:phosphoribosylglycinamide formyltransferase [Cytophaga hutchinsonii]ABG60549.1 formyltetrahydrofolate-dependent phosphoribosylglycinamide formyltransferase [Cytophaga hutchinsonii ATCC 33406]SFX90293.1 formyltetrahydrofolate-dependent phosphoribosylglycinamide formyltransferase [Cytophaga hutchinsonii ATCC 33406]
MQVSKPIKVAIFASGSGTNAQRIFDYFKEKEGVEVALLLSNNPDAYALTRAKAASIPTRVFTKAEFKDSTIIVDELKAAGISWVILAGFLWLVPKSLIQAFPNSILNIHPALLPAFGGKGMYGMHVHKAVIETKAKQTGITIHKVNEEYDKGEVVFQAAFDVLSHDTPESVAEKIHELEHKHFPLVIEEQINKSL